ncbi:hypothetical protein D3C87_2101600 [compost metagenome]
MGYSYLPDAFSFSSAAVNSSPLQGFSRVGIRIWCSSSTDFRANIPTAASHKPTEYRLSFHLPMAPGRKLASFSSGMGRGWR